MDGVLELGAKMKLDIRIIIKKKPVDVCSVYCCAVKVYGGLVMLEYDASGDLITGALDILCWHTRVK